MFYVSEKEYKNKLKQIKEKNEGKKRWLLLMNERKKGRHFSFAKISTSNKVLTSSIIAVILFTIACLYIQLVTGTEVSSTLIALWFSFWTVEILSLAGIKISKVFKSQNLNENKTEDSAS